MPTATNGILIAATIFAGAVLPLQALINGRLGAHLQTPMWAGALQNTVGALAMIAVALAMRAPFPTGGQLASPPPWAWLGGVLGATYVMIALVATPRLGAGPAIVGMIAGQMVASLALDHFGVLHEKKPVDLGAIAGVLLVGAGAFLIMRRA
jgi:transporter family-2 protein